MIRGEFMGREEGKGSTNKAKYNIHRFTQKNIQKHIKQIDNIMRNEKQFTFKDICKYLWSLIALGINWMVYEKLFVVLLIAIVLVGALVLSPVIGVILCLFTPLFLQLYGRYFYININSKYENIEKSEKQRLLIPSSLLIVWVLIIFVIILLII